MMDKRVPARARFRAARPPEVDGKADRTTASMAGHWMVGQWRGGVAVVGMAGHVGKETAPRLAQGGIADEGGVGLRPPCVGWWGDATLMDLLWQPGRFRAEAGQVRLVRALQHTAGAGGSALVVQDAQACQIMLEMVKLAPMLAEVPEDVRMRSHQGSGSPDGKRHQAWPLSREGV